LRFFDHGQTLPFHAERKATDDQLLAFAKAAFHLSALLPTIVLTLSAEPALLAVMLELEMRLVMGDGAV
jgi:hypothetical protein